MFTSINHVVIAVKDLDKAIEQYESIYGLKVGNMGGGGGGGQRPANAEQAAGNAEGQAGGAQQGGGGGGQGGGGGGGGFRGVIMRFGDGRWIELVTPTNENHPMARRINQVGEGIYFVAMRVDNLEKTIEDLESKGVRIVRDPGGLVFVHPSATSGVLTRIMQDPDVDPAKA